MDRKPLRTFMLLRFFPGAREPVVFSLPPGIAFLPLRLDEAFRLKAMEDGIEHALRPLEFAAGEFLDALDQRVTVTFAAGEQAEEQRAGGGGDELTSRHRALMPCSSRYVKQPTKKRPDTQQSASGR